MNWILELEYTSILLYLFGVYGLLLLAVDSRSLRPTLISTALYFLIWMSLLFVQFKNPEEYRIITNIISTPTLLGFVISIYINLWLLRKSKSN